MLGIGGYCRGLPLRYRIDSKLYSLSYFSFYLFVKNTIFTGEIYNNTSVIILLETENLLNMTLRNIQLRQEYWNLLKKQTFLNFQLYRINIS